MHEQVRPNPEPLGAHGQPQPKPSETYELDLSPIFEDINTFEGSPFAVVGSGLGVDEVSFFITKYSTNDMTVLCRWQVKDRIDSPVVRHSSFDLPRAGLPTVSSVTMLR